MLLDLFRHSNVAGTLKCVEGKQRRDAAPDSSPGQHGNHLMYRADGILETIGVFLA